MDVGGGLQQWLMVLVTLENNCLSYAHETWHIDDGPSNLM